MEVRNGLTNSLGAVMHGGEYMKAVSSLALLGAVVAFGGVAAADEATSPFSGNVAITSDYVFRGISQSNGGIALSGGFDYANESSFYAGVWASSVDFNAPTNLEVDVYAGFKPTFGPLDMDIGVVGYIYPDNDSDFDYLEAYAKASHTYGNGLTLGAAAFVSPEYFGETGLAYYLEANGALPITDAFGVSGAVGFQDVEDGVTVNDDNYVTWNVGGTVNVAGFGVDLRYHDSSIDEADLEGVGPRGVLTLKRAF
jgi:uncharacterized protein (TIGR02001 family)